MFVLLEPQASGTATLFLRATLPRVVEPLKPKTDDSRGNSRLDCNQGNFVLLESVPLPLRWLADVSVRGGVRPLIDLDEACG